MTKNTQFPAPVIEVQESMMREKYQSTDFGLFSCEKIFVISIGRIEWWEHFVTISIRQVACFIAIKSCSTRYASDLCWFIIMIGFVTDENCSMIIRWNCSWSFLFLRRRTMFVQKIIFTFQRDTNRWNLPVEMMWKRRNNRKIGFPTKSKSKCMSNAIPCGHRWRWT